MKHPEEQKKSGFRVELAEGDVWMQDLIAAHQPEERPNVEVTPEDIAVFQYSGGTTGTPKAAIALHRNLVANTLQIKAWFHVAKKGQEVVLMSIPLYHVYGMVAGMNLAMAIGASLVMIPDARDIKDGLDNLQKYKATLFPAVPTLYNAINNWPDVVAGKYDLSSITACISGSAPLMRETKERFEHLTGGVLFEGYGLSEAPTATHCNPLTGENRIGSIGLPLPDVDARIISLDDEETVLSPGEIGELVIKGPQVFKGYFGMPTETNNTLRGEWLYTGDIARMDEEGYFYIVDRKKDMILSAGYNVYPREVEEVLYQHPKVLEAAVIGIPDGVRGERIAAYLTLKPGEQATPAEIRTFCRERLAPYKQPRTVRFREDLPKSLAGKVLRRQLREEILAEMGSEQ